MIIQKKEIRKAKISTYVTILAFIIFILQACKTDKKESPIQEEKDYTTMVFPHLDTKNSRWFYFSSASRPFGMVNLSPDTQIGGAWGSGYRYDTDTIKGFSHIHAWQLSGISVMPVSFTKENKQKLYTDFYSEFSHETEAVSPGFHKLSLSRYAIDVRLTSTTRVGFSEFSFNSNQHKGVLFNLNTLLGPSTNTDGMITQIDAKTLKGSVVATPTQRRPKPIKIHFYVNFDQTIEALEQDPETKNALLIFPDETKTFKMKVGISYTSAENAKRNLEAELPEWNFEQTVVDAQKQWNRLLGRIEVSGSSDKAQRRFYTDLWHALQGRRIISDYNGQYPDHTGNTFRIGQLPLDANDRPRFNHYNSDSFWGAQWTINTLWGLVYPEVMKEFTLSLMQYYKDGGLVPRGPSGGNYTYVMTGATSTPFIVSAIQKGIVDQNIDSIYQALKKNHMPDGIMSKAGYEHNTSHGGGLSHYLERGFIPYPLPEGNFGLHQDGPGLTLEYAYQDWTLAQLAKKLKLNEDETYFLKRSGNYKNVFNPALGWMQPKDKTGNWFKNYDPYEDEVGFVEANATQFTWFVPQDLEGLARLMGGNEQAVEKLNKQFEEAEKLGFTSGDSHEAELHPEFNRIPINYGNQPSIQTAFIFNQLGRPDLTQYWSRKVVDRVFSGLDESTGYNGDEDQGLMGSLAVLMKIGLFQMNGGTEENPEYQIGSPIFDSVTLHLNSTFYPGETFVIKTENNNETNVYVENLKLNEKSHLSTTIRHQELISGGILQLKMSNSPKVKY
ncbi:GH92 family glycosyl hydrolase [Leeuwenhoekiella sp. UBA6783]|uniref:GH92 family glycosyl hydrolase n=1 Tax=Leeuwenhoekiella sp. UBA6783 TaxID=1946747 RepID=UPI0025BFEC27|nr:GH92 family glycosyl hydrolase [Leeuwenhoekiella sp. UBA6783]|tara:strand:- start:2188 stop:4530 length:2343 start_codon:yes stop_codon:yes gene_type:complete